jgi:glycosyltransferase involved in cell wall biosynthesis
MKICFLIGSLSNIGGTEKITISLANRLTLDGYKIVIISLNTEKEIFFDIDKSITIYSIFKKPRKYIFYIPLIIYTLYKMIKKLKIEILINVDVILSLFSLPIKIFNHRLKIISWEHFNYKINLGVLRRDFSRFLSKKYADAIVTLTEQDKNFYLEDGKSKTTIVCIPNFIENIPSIISSLNKKNVIAIGRFTHQKGFDILIDVWKLVLLNPISVDWKLKIIGDGNDKAIIEKKIEDLKLEYCIELVEVTNLHDYYISASLYVMTSRFEGLPMVLLEAQSYGLPIISFDCLTGPRDVVNDRKNGYLIPMGEIQLMANKICELFSDEKKRKDMGNVARKDVFRFSRENIILKWKYLFHLI